MFFIAIMRIPPGKLQRPFIISSIMFGGTLIGLLAWAVTNTHSGCPLFVQAGNPIHSGTDWAMIFGINAVLGPRPFCLILCAVIGIIVTSCAQEIIGQLIWEPLLLLAALQEFYNDSPRARAGVFFAGLGCACVQLGISIVPNTVSASMDLASLCSREVQWMNPLHSRYINIRSGAYILVFLGLASNPWQSLSNVATFLTVLLGFSIFSVLPTSNPTSFAVAPFMGIMLADYLVPADATTGAHIPYRQDNHHGVEISLFASSRYPWQSNLLSTDAHGSPHSMLSARRPRVPHLHAHLFPAWYPSLAKHQSITVSVILAAKFTALPLLTAGLLA
ncbi:hypothetical protein BV22DRAFT_1134648 [Leucogyrophana mollusca]|uniref:Uncharacterized protein n=1 Tax=Leucogyrophana mollusca TaxID=85980 RepID=A0ACB8AY81_9AGAM|nr:hypothetical protein BV22DRAFT_1134648 [Leucogyrophana mollusca]